MSSRNGTKGGAVKDDADRLPPHSREAERSLLGSMLRDNRLISDVVVLTKAGDFYVYAHQLVFGAIVALNQSGKKADIVTVAEWLIKAKQIDDVGYSYAAELHDAAPAAENFRQYADIVREHSIARQLIQRGLEISALGYDQSDTADERLAQSERLILDIAEQATINDTSTLQQAMVFANQKIEDRWTRIRQGAEMSGVPSGFIDLDKITNGFQDGEMTVLAARPSIGKTSIALGIALNAIQNEAPTLFVSLEQSREELVERLLCTHARVNSYDMKRDKVTPEGLERLFAAQAILSELPLVIDDGKHGQTVMRIGANARRLKRRIGLKMVIVDYVQLIQPDNYREPRERQVASMSRQLKFLADELKIPVIALAQLNRESASANSRPKLHMIRESDALGQDADMALLLWNPDLEKRSEVQVVVEKNRNGAQGDLMLMFDRPFMRFENFAFDNPTSFNHVP